MKYRILQDELAENPNQEDCFIVYDHKSFTVEVEGIEPDDIYTHLKCKEQVEYYNSLTELHETQSEDRDSCLTGMNEDFDNYNIYPLFAYIHSSVSLSLGNTSYPFNCKWDTSMKGFLVTTKDYDGDVNKFIEVWNDYLMNGELMVEIYKEEMCKCCGGTAEEQIDLIGGFYNYEEAEEYGKDYCIRNTSGIEL